MAWTSLCDFAELKAGEGKYVEIDGFQLAVFVDNGQAHVIDNTCPHAGGNLAAGFVEEGCAVCPWHLWAFHLQNGQLRDAPRVTVTTYKTRTFTPQGRAPLVQADLPMY